MGFEWNVTSLQWRLFQIKLANLKTWKWTWKCALWGPKFVDGFFTAWHNLTTRREMIKIKWRYTSLQRVFEVDFQKQAMIDNIKTSSFNIEENVGVETNNNNNNEETCVKVFFDIILEDSLTRVSLLTTSRNMTNMATLRSMTRKMPPFASSSTTNSDSRVEIVTRRSNPLVQLQPILG